MLWFTCLKCGSRWERVALVVDHSASTPSPRAPSPARVPTKSSVTPPGPVAQKASVPSSTVPVDKKKVTFLDPNTKRKTEDFQMVGLTPMGEKVFRRYQDLLQTDVPHEAVVKQLMAMASNQEEIAAVVEVIQNQRGS